MSFTAAEKRRVFETKSGIVYTAGQGGTLIFSSSFTTVSNAEVAGVQQAVGTILTIINVLGVGLATGTVGTVAPAPNGIKIFAQQIVGTTGVTESPSGTLPPFTLLVEGT